MYCHLLKLEKEECKGKKQILFAWLADVISCRWRIIKHCFLCCVPEELQFAKCNWVSEDTHYSKCQPWRERQCSWHLPLKAKGKGILSPTGGSQWSSTPQHCFCSPVMVLPLSIWGENRMTNRACSCDVSKTVIVRAVKPFLGEKAEDSAVAFWPESPDWWELHP